MTQPARLIAALQFALALFLGWAAFLAAYIGHLAAWIHFRESLGMFALLTGFPTFGGAHLTIHMINVAIWAIPAALAYGGVMRLMFRRPIIWWRLAAMYVLGVGTAAVVAKLDAWGLVPLPEGINAFHLVYAIVGLVVVRTWVVPRRPADEKAPTV